MEATIETLLAHFALDASSLVIEALRGKLHGARAVFARLSAFEATVDTLGIVTSGIALINEFQAAAAVNASTHDSVLAFFQGVVGLTDLFEGAPLLGFGLSLLGKLVASIRDTQAITSDYRDLVVDVITTHNITLQVLLHHGLQHVLDHETDPVLQQVREFLGELIAVCDESDVLKGGGKVGRWLQRDANKQRLVTLRANLQRAYSRLGLGVAVATYATARSTETAVGAVLDELADAAQRQLLQTAVQAEHGVTLDQTVDLLNAVHIDTGVILLTQAQHGSELHATHQSVGAIETSQVQHGALLTAIHSAVVTSPTVAPPIDLASYAASIIRRYGPVQGLDQLSTDGSAYDDVKLLHIFVPQSVRELKGHPKQLLDMPHELVDQLRSGGELAGWDDVVGTSLGANRREYEQQQAQSVLDELAVHPFVVVLGDPGAGKSSLVHYQLMQWASLDPAVRESTPFPFILDLGGKFSRRSDLASYSPATFVAHLAEFGGALNLPLERSAVLARLCGVPALADAPSHHIATVFFDALDEVFDRVARDTVAEAIVAFAAAYPRVHVLVTSRSIGYNPRPFRDGGFEQRVLQELDDGQIQQFVAQWHEVTWSGADEERRMARKESLLAAVHAPAIRQLAGNPLLLTMMAILNRTLNELPRGRHELYEECTRVLLGRWKVDEAMAADPQLRDLGRLFGAAEKAALLRRLAREMQVGNRCALGNLVLEAPLVRLFASEIELILGNAAVSPVAVAKAIVAQLNERNFILSFVGGKAYAFLHRTFLEYFCAMDIQDRFEAERTMTPQQLVAVFVTRCRDDTWTEVLTLLAGMIRPTFVAGCLVAVIPYNLFLVSSCIDEMKMPHTLASFVAEEETLRCNVVSHMNSAHLMRGRRHVPTAPLVLSALWPHHPQTYHILCETARSNVEGRWAATRASCGTGRTVTIRRPCLSWLHKPPTCVLPRSPSMLLHCTGSGFQPRSPCCVALLCLGASCRR